MSVNKTSATKDATSRSGKCEQNLSSTDQTFAAQSQEIRAMDILRARISVTPFVAPFSSVPPSSNRAALLTPFLDLIYDRRLNESGARTLADLFGIHCDVFLAVDSQVYPASVMLPTGLPAILTTTYAPRVDAAIHKMIVACDPRSGFDTVKTVGDLTIGNSQLAIGVVYRGADDGSEQTDAALSYIHRWLKTELVKPEWSTIDTSSDNLMALFLVSNASGELLWQDRRSLHISGHDAKRALWNTLNGLRMSLKTNVPQRDGWSMIALQKNPTSLSETELHDVELSENSFDKTPLPNAVTSRLNRTLLANPSRLEAPGASQNTTDTYVTRAQRLVAGAELRNTSEKSLFGQVTSHTAVSEAIARRLGNLPPGAKITMTHKTSDPWATVRVIDSLGKTIHTIDLAELMTPSYIHEKK